MAVGGWRGFQHDMSLPIILTSPWHCKVHVRRALPGVMWCLFGCGGRAVPAAWAEAAAGQRVGHFHASVAAPCATRIVAAAW